MLSTTLGEYLRGIKPRMLPGYMQALLSLSDGDVMNKEELSISSRIKRAELDHILLQLVALGLVDCMAQGKAKMCRITQLGSSYLKLFG